VGKPTGTDVPNRSDKGSLRSAYRWLVKADCCETGEMAAGTVIAQLGDTMERAQLAEA
jgi:hypothetical protein